MADAPDERPTSRFAVTVDELDRVHVPFEDQVTVQDESPVDPFPGEWSQERNQLRLAGGA